MLMAICASCPPELFNFGQSQSEFNPEDIHEVSRQLGQGAGSPRPLWNGGCWCVLL